MSMLYLGRLRNRRFDLIGKEPSFGQWMALFAAAFLGGALLGALIGGVYAYVTFTFDPNCVALFCVNSASANAVWGALGGSLVGTLAGIGLWVIAKIAVPVIVRHRS